MKDPFSNSALCQPPRETVAAVGAVSGRAGRLQDEEILEWTTNV